MGCTKSLKPQPQALNPKPCMVPDLGFTAEDFLGLGVLGLHRCWITCLGFLGFRDHNAQQRLKIERLPRKVESLGEAWTEGSVTKRG